ncbi:MAG: hypothetical protein L0Z53_14650 [Acidobacteriales bacterium]|nr:hypothetical protein [Terriglobales bacterium]
MKTIACFILLVASACAQTARPAAVDPAQEANTKRARALVDQAIQALGGQAYLSVLDISLEGRTYSFYQGEAKGVGLRFWRFWKWPDKDRIELTKQRDVVYTHNGDKGYETTFRGTRPEVAKDLRDFLRRRDYSLPRMLRVWLNEPGVSFYYDGAAVAENKPAEQVTISTDNGQTQILYLDKFKFLPIAKSFIYRDPETRERNEELEGYDNYHLVQGVNTPYTVTRKRNGEMIGQVFVTKVVYNSGLSDSLFTPTVTYDPDAKKRQNP